MSLDVPSLEAEVVTGQPPAPSSGSLVLADGSKRSVELFSREGKVQDSSSTTTVTSVATRCFSFSLPAPLKKAWAALQLMISSKGVRKSKQVAETVLAKPKVFDQPALSALSEPPVVRPAALEARKLISSWSLGAQEPLRKELRQFAAELMKESKTVGNFTTMDQAAVGKWLGDQKAWKQRLKTEAFKNEKPPETHARLCKILFGPELQPNESSWPFPLKS